MWEKEMRENVHYRAHYTKGKQIGEIIRESDQLIKKYTLFQYSS